MVEALIRTAKEQQEEKDANKAREVGTSQRARMLNFFRKDDAQLPEAEAKAKAETAHAVTEMKQEEYNAAISGTVETKEGAPEESKKQPPTETTTVPMIWKGDLRPGHGPASAEAALQRTYSRGVAYVVHRRVLHVDDCALQVGTALQDIIVGLVAIQSGNSTQKKIEQLMYDALKPLEQWSLFFFSNNLILLPFAHVSLLASTSKGHRSAEGTGNNHSASPLALALSSFYCCAVSFFWLLGCWSTRSNEGWYTSSSLPRSGR